MKKNAKRKTTGKNYPVVDERGDEICTLQPFPFADPKGIFWLEIWEPADRFEISEFDMEDLPDGTRAVTLYACPQCNTVQMKEVW